MQAPSASCTLCPGWEETTGAPSNKLGIGTDPFPNEGLRALHHSLGEDWSRRDSAGASELQEDPTPEIPHGNGCTDCKGIKAQRFLCSGPLLEEAA